MHPALVVARDPPRPRARLNLAPRLHPDETLSSWLERFAGAYGMTLRELFLWLGYRNFLGYCEVPHDLDVSPPPDLAGVLASHTGLSAELLAAHRMEAFDALPPRWRRTFCPECWIEEGPYRCFEWAHNLSLVCRRHRRFLSERPRRAGPFLPWHEESWTEFYHDTNAWQDLRPSWESEPWIRICTCLGVEPHAEFLRAWPWLIKLSHAAPDPWKRAEASIADDPRDHGAVEDARGGEDLRVEEVTAKQDVALYAMIRFYDFSLLQTLDETISRDDLMSDHSGGRLCDVRTPEVRYEIRLFAATVARHLWTRITQGEWRCGRARARSGRGSRA
ncbi:MAG: TniQ family protein [Proteobacteria bacterium]|nr:TniQ family protein [Pseudomonadota bacterium]